jgi:hypothetical protein
MCGKKDQPTSLWRCMGFAGCVRDVPWDLPLNRHDVHAQELSGPAEHMAADVRAYGGRCEIPCHLYYS